MRKTTQGIGYRLAVCVLASGSKGNAIFISNGETSILIDAGLSGIEIERRLRSKNLSPKMLDAIFVSHEHADHIQAVGVLSRRFDLPVYITPKTSAAAANQLGRIKDLRFFECGLSFIMGSLIIHPFSISHDAVDPSGFTITHAERKIGIATDLGIGTTVVKEHLKRCDLLIIEANHDPAMLAAGPYPWALKQRIKSRTGHLSNEDSLKLLNEVGHSNLKHVILAHLSEINNTPQHALRAVDRKLDNCRPDLSVALQATSGKVVFIK